MPIVRIDLIEGKSEEYRAQVGPGIAILMATIVL
jgi:phenylpyruvate tautomerase PptA (4-oxalocrotonate tautomerase family)